MQERTFVIPGMPRGKDRPRFTRTGHAYTTKRTVDYEQLIRKTYCARYPSALIATDVPVIVEICACFPVPQGDSRRKRLAKLSGEIMPTKKPDCDNIAKVVCDALNGLAYADDKQIVRCIVTKRYDKEAHVLVRIRTIDGHGTEAQEGVENPRF